MKIRVLGSLHVDCGGISATPTAAKVRTLLALLAVHANEPVPFDMLVAELWGEKPPASAKATIQTYVMQLRKTISRAFLRTPGIADQDPKAMVVTRPGSYLLAAVQPVDMQSFDQLTMAGHRAREAGDYRLAAGRFAEALACWRGPALLDVQLGEHLRIDVKRLEEARLNVLDRRIDADLRLGRHYELLGELSAVVEQYRYHEGLAAHYMVALHRSGRRGHALDYYRQLEARLADDLALKPSAPLRRLQRAMLVPDHGGAELTESWQAATAHRGIPRQPAAGGGAVPAPIPAEVAGLSWRAGDEDEFSAADVRHRRSPRR